MESDDNSDCSEMTSNSLPDLSMVLKSDSDSQLSVILKTALLVFFCIAIILCGLW
jgi:hypothetical protein